MGRLGRETTYEKFMKQEGIPVYGGYGIKDVRELELDPWERLDGRGAYIHLDGMEGMTGMYVGEIPAGGALKPEKHLYDKIVYVLRGQGTTEVWQRPDSPRRVFEWHAGAVFSPPINTWHRLYNTSGAEPVQFLCVTTAPIVLDLFHNVDFTFQCDWAFTDRYDERHDYFDVGERVESDNTWGKVWVWETNYIPDVRDTALPSSSFGEGGKAINYEMSGNVLQGHVAEWPVGGRNKAHFHGGGAILHILGGRGYTIMWPIKYGIHPYQEGHGDQVVRVNWQEGSVFGPPSNWFHQHFVLGTAPARQLALRHGSKNFGVEFHDISQAGGVGLDIKKGGAMIEYEDEDPEIRRIYQRELEKDRVMAPA